MSGHRWSGWPGAYCLRCGAEQVLELALAENWFAPAEQGDAEVWKSEDHKALVDLCDAYCYSDMTPAEIVEHQAKIDALCRKIGYGKYAQQKPVPEVPPPESSPVPG